MCFCIRKGAAQGRRTQPSSSSYGPASIVSKQTVGLSFKEEKSSLQKAGILNRGVNILYRKCSSRVYLVFSQRVSFALRPALTDSFVSAIRVSALKARKNAILQLWSQWHCHAALAPREESVTLVVALVLTVKNGCIQSRTNTQKDVDKLKWATPEGPQAAKHAQESSKLLERLLKRCRSS